MLSSYSTFLAIYARNNFTTSRLNHDVSVDAQKYDKFSQLCNWSVITIGFERQCGIWGKECGTEIVIPEGVIVWQARLVHADTWFVISAKTFAIHMCPFEVVRSIIIEVDIIAEPKVHAEGSFVFANFLPFTFPVEGDNIYILPMLSESKYKLQCWTTIFQLFYLIFNIVC